MMSFSVAAAAQHSSYFGTQLMQQHAVKALHGSRRRISKNKYIPVMKIGSFILEKCAAQSIFNVL